MTEDLPRLFAALADRYTIERELGRGGMATVYLARDLKHRRLVALKVLRPELTLALGPFSARSRSRHISFIPTSSRCSIPARPTGSSTM